MDHLISWDTDPPTVGARVARVGIARVVCVEVISLRPQVLVDLDAHPDRVALGRLGHVVIDQVIRLQHLQRERHPAVAERPLNHPNEHLARFGHAADQQPLDVMEAKDATHITAALMHPPLPLLMDLPVQQLVELAAAQHPHLPLMADAVPDHIVLDRAQCLLGVVVVTAQLPRTVAQCLKTRLDLRVGAGAARHPVRCQPADPRTLIRPLPRPHRFKPHRPE